MRWPATTQFWRRTSLRVLMRNRWSAWRRRVSFVVGLQLAQAAVSHVEQLKLRLAEILRRDRSAAGQGSSLRSKSAIAFDVASLQSLLFAGFRHAPRLVAFSIASQRWRRQSRGIAGQFQGCPTHRLQPVNLTLHRAFATGGSGVHKVQPARQGLRHRAAAKSASDRCQSSGLKIVDMTRSASSSHPDIFTTSETELTADARARRAAG